MEGDNCEHGLAIDPAIDVEEERVDSSRTMRRIVVAVDGSDGSDMAVHYALQRIADPITDHLFLLHVKTPRHLPSDSLAAAAPTCLPSSLCASSFARRGNTKDHTPTTANTAPPSNGRFSRKRQHDSLRFSVWPSAVSGPTESYHADRASSASLGASTDRAAALLASCFLDAAATAATPAAAPAAPAALTPWQLPRAPIRRLSESGAGVGGGNGAEPLRHVRRRSVDWLRMSGSSASAAPESAEMRKAAVAAALMLESAFESSGGAAAAAAGCLDSSVAGAGDHKTKAASAVLWSRVDGDLEGSGSANRPDMPLPAVHCFPGGFGAVKSGEKRAGATNAGTGNDDWARRFRGADAHGAAGGAWCGGSCGSGGSVRAHGRRLGRPMRQQQQQQHMDVKVGIVTNDGCLVARGGAAEESNGIPKNQVPSGRSFGSPSSYFFSPKFPHCLTASLPRCRTVPQCCLRVNLVPCWSAVGKGETYVRLCGVVHGCVHACMGPVRTHLLLSHSPSFPHSACPLSPPPPPAHQAMDPCEAVLCRVHAVRAHLLILSGHLADSAGGAAAFASDPHTFPAPPVTAAAATVAAASSSVSSVGAGAGAGGVGVLSGVRTRGGLERNVRENCTVSKEDLAVAVSRFPNLTHLHLSDGSVDRLDDDFLSRLASSCPRLTTLHVGWGISRSLRKCIKFEHPITSVGLDILFQKCTGLQQLSIFRSLNFGDLPASFFQLSHLRTLLLTDPAVLNKPKVRNFTSLGTLYTGFPFFDRHLSTLAHLPGLSHLSIRSFWQVGHDSSPSSMPTSLQSLKLSNSCPPDDFIFLESPCTRLEDLQVSGYQQLHHLPDHLGELLPRLRRLIMKDCYLVDLPDDFTSLNRLEILVLSDCRPMESLPRNFGDLPALKMLTLVDLDISALPDSFSNLTSLQVLVLNSDPLQLTGGFGELANLQVLHLSNIHDLPASLTGLSSLTELHLNSCNISELPEGMQGLQNLKTLWFCNCNRIRTLPVSLASLPRLESLRFQIDSDRQALHDDDNEPSINLVSVPEGLESLGKLKELELSGCGSLPRIPQHLPRSLEVLRVGNVSHATYLPDLSLLPNLMDLTFDLPHLECGMAMSRKLTLLQHLTLRLPDTATELPFPLTFPQLRSLTIRASGLEKLPEGIATMVPQLWKLNVEWTESLDTLLASISELRSLTSLEIAADGAGVCWAEKSP
ncbi:unnamed protein product [Closterium sp. NIES-54]